MRVARQLCIAGMAAALALLPAPSDWPLSSTGAMAAKGGKDGDGGKGGGRDDGGRGGGEGRGGDRDDSQGGDKDSGEGAGDKDSKDDDTADSGAGGNEPSGGNSGGGGNAGPGGSEQDTSAGAAPDPGSGGGPDDADVDRGDPDDLARSARGTVARVPDRDRDENSEAAYSPPSLPRILPWMAVVAPITGDRSKWTWVDAPIQGEPKTPSKLRELTQGEENEALAKEWR